MLSPALLGRFWGAEFDEFGGFEPAGCHSALTQGSGLPCVHYAAQHDLLGSADGLWAQFSGQNREALSKL